MMKEVKFYGCDRCKVITEVVSGNPGPLSCCGAPMQEMKANTSDGATEKHVPEVTIDGNKVTVQVGSVLHPMLEEHHIAWVEVVTKKGIQRAYSYPGEKPVVEFFIAPEDQVVAVYEFCNLHGLWKVELA